MEEVSTAMAEVAHNLAAQLEMAEKVGGGFNKGAQGADLGSITEKEGLEEVEEHTEREGVLEVEEGTQEGHQGIMFQSHAVVVGDLIIPGGIK